ncbi:Golgi membrane exchange factor (Ric1p-Rgp1p) subunit [Savitreella phatthalungensis]
MLDVQVEVDKERYLPSDALVAQIKLSCRHVDRKASTSSAAQHVRSRLPQRPMSSDVRPPHTRRISLVDVQELAETQIESSNGDFLQSPRMQLMMACAYITGTAVVEKSLLKSTGLEQLALIGSSAELAAGSFLTKTFPTAAERVLGGLRSLVVSESASSLADRHSNHTSNAIPVLTTVQSVLGINFEVAVDRPTILTYRVALPDVLPPSFLGHLVKISYRLAVVVQYADRTLCTTEAPLRIAGSLTGILQSYDFHSPHVWTSDRSQQSSSSESAEHIVHRARVSRIILALTEGRALPSEETEIGINENKANRLALERAFQAARSAPLRFDLGYKGRAIGQLVLDRSILCAGDTLFAKAIFGGTSAAMHCVYLTATLYSIEIPNSSASTAGAHRRKLVRTSRQSTVDKEIAPFELIVPTLTPPSFATSLVSLKHCLTLQFALSNADDLPSTQARYGRHNYIHPEQPSTFDYECEIDISVLPRTRN